MVAEMSPKRREYEFPASLLLRLEKFLIKAIGNALEPLGLTASQWQVLSLADVEPPVRASDLAKESGMDAGAMSRLVDVLEKRGLVTRTRCQIDRRSVCVSLTIDGSRMLREAGRSVRRLLAPVRESLGDDAVRAFRVLLERSVQEARNLKQ